MGTTALSNAQIIAVTARAAVEANLDLYEVWVSRGLKCVYSFRLDGKEVVAFYLFNRRITEDELFVELVQVFTDPSSALTDSPFKKE